MPRISFWNDIAAPKGLKTGAQPTPVVPAQCHGAYGYGLALPYWLDRTRADPTLLPTFLGGLRTHHGTDALLSLLGEPRKEGLSSTNITVAQAIAVLERELVSDTTTRP